MLNKFFFYSDVTLKYLNHYLIATTEINYVS